MNRSQITLLSFCALALVACMSTAGAASISLHADLDGLQMVPPNASPAFGVLDATLDDGTGAFAVTLGSYNDLLGGSIAILLNDAAIGVNGPLIFALTNDTPGAATGTFSGGGILTAPQITDMLAGNTYVRVSSQVFPGGELRGQLQVVPEPAGMVLLAIGGGVAALAAWRSRRRTAR